MNGKDNSATSRTLDAPVLRRAQIQDMAALLAIEAEFATDRISARQMRRHVSSASAECWVASDGRILGYALLFFRRNSERVRLYSLAVAAQARGSGIGKALLLRALERTAARRCCELRLEVRTSNCAALKLYRGLGFVPFAQIEDYYQDGEAALRLRLRVRPQSRAS